jgi:hypothetical protein
MSKGIIVGNLTANGSLFINIEGFSGTRFTLKVDGVTLSGGSLAVKGGDGVNYEPVMVTDPTDGTHAALAVAGGSSTMGSQSFDACCSHLEFELTGATSPDVDVTLFPEPRS